MRPSTRHAIDMLYRCKWNLPEAAEYADMSNDEMRRTCLLYTSPSPRDRYGSRMPSSA